MYASTALLRMGCILILKYIYETGLAGMQQIQTIHDYNGFHVFAFQFLLEFAKLPLSLI